MRGVGSLPRNDRKDINVLILLVCLEVLSKWSRRAFRRIGIYALKHRGRLVGQRVHSAFSNGHAFLFDKGQLAAWDCDHWIDSISTSTLHRSEKIK
jgi:hypothetical protein